MKGIVPVYPHFCSGRYVLQKLSVHYEPVRSVIKKNNEVVKLTLVNYNTDDDNTHFKQKSLTEYY